MSIRVMIAEAFLILVVGLHTFSLASSSHSLSTTSYIVRVLIDEKKETDGTAWNIKSSTGFLLSEPDRSNLKWRRDQDTISIQGRNKHIYLNKKCCPTNNLYIEPQDGYATINGQQYQGTFSVLFYDQRLLLINHVDLEEYVHAVLKTESWPGWPIEVNKVFAIISRSYVIAMMHQAETNPRIPPLPYHIKNTNEHQTYKGMHEVRTIRAAIQQTRGIFLVYNNKPALTMFDSCCGGIIPANIEGVDFKKAPYLARNYACTHCARCQIYTWKAALSLDEFRHQVHHFLDHGARADNAIITKRDKAGLVQEVELRNRSYGKRITGKQFYRALAAIKSFCFTMERNGNNILLEGRGFGHHLGLCQWGAREMVRDGWHYKRILSFYYPTLQLAQLQ